MDEKQMQPCDLVYVVGTDGVGHKVVRPGCLVAVGPGGVLVADVQIGAKYTMVGYNGCLLLAKSEVFPTREAAEASIAKVGQPKGAPMQ